MKPLLLAALAFAIVTRTVAGMFPEVRELSQKTTTTILISLLFLPALAAVACYYLQSPYPLIFSMFLMVGVPRYLWEMEVSARLRRGEGYLGPRDPTGKKATRAIITGIISMIALFLAMVMPAGLWSALLFAICAIGLLYVNRVIRGQYMEK